MNDLDSNQAIFDFSLRLDGLDPMIAYAMGAATGHTVVALWRYIQNIFTYIYLYIYTQNEQLHMHTELHEQSGKLPVYSNPT